MDVEDLVTKHNQKKQAKKDFELAFKNLKPDTQVYRVFLYLIGRRN